MIDVRELQKRGVVRIPKNDIVIPTNKDGFVELGNNEKPNQKPQPSSTSSNAEFFGFMDSSSTTDSQEPTTDNREPASTNFTNKSVRVLPTTDYPGGYNKRDVDEKITELDNKIYKLENRIEVLEKKLDIDQSPDAPVGVMGW